jgi:Domain of unknown function (DUF4124)
MRRMNLSQSKGLPVEQQAVAWRALGAATVALLLFCASPSATAQVYRWVDDQGVIHLSSEKPPPGVKAERLDIGGSGKRTSTGAKPGPSSQGGKGPTTAPASPEVLASRAELLGRLRTRECVIALEALDRKTSGTEPTSADEIRRLKQTAELNCSQDPVLRRQQEEMAARLRVANSPSCVEARNKLGDMMAPGSSVPRDQVKAQQAFVDEHCTSPIR